MEKINWHIDDNSQDGAVLFDQLYRSLYPRLVHHAFTKINDRGAAEDIVQDSFIQLYRHFHKTQQPVHYLKVVIKNKIFDYWRKEAVKDNYATLIAHSGEQNTQQPWDSLLEKELKQEYLKQLDSLTPSCRTVFLLRREAHLSNKQIAAKLGISVNTVEQHMRKALKILKGYFNYYSPIFIAFWHLLKK